MSLTAIIAACALGQQAQPINIKLWPNGAPGSESKKDVPETAKDWWVKNIHNPSMDVFMPPKDKANGAAIVVFAGGGHNQLVYPPEGIEPAQFLASKGYVAIAVKYRLFREEGSLTTFADTKVDSYRAMRQVRAHAAEWGIDSNRVGVLGFSAGGENVFSIAFGNGAGDPNAPDKVDRENGKPNFIMQVYPGPLGVPETIPADAPPAFMIVANDDGAAGVVLNVAAKYRAAKAPIEVHLLAQGGHGFNMGTRSKLVSVNTWPQRMVEWLSDNGWATKK
ncbi:MAG TPA: alpha/beta hydrolase [Fimbriimonas sp.]|nr:alpha/beta hydrolase [Fimbriimonas sp.]